MTSDRVALATELLTEHPDVRGVVLTERDGGLLAAVLPGDYCGGADLRDALISGTGLEPAPPVVVLVPDETEFAALRADPAGVAALLADSPYVYRWQEPASEHERALCAVITECLERDRASLSDNFVDLGGDSMAAITVVSTFEERSGIALPLESLFESESIADLAELAGQLAGVAR